MESQELIIFLEFLDFLSKIHRGDLLLAQLNPRFSHFFLHFLIS